MTIALSPPHPRWWQSRTARRFRRHRLAMAGLAIIVVLTLIVITTAVLATVRSVRRGTSSDTEDPFVESKIYAPAGFVITPAERELEREWEAHRAETPEPARRASH